MMSGMDESDITVKYFANEIKREKEEQKRKRANEKQIKKLQNELEKIIKDKPIYSKEVLIEIDAAESIIHCLRSFYSNTSLERANAWESEMLQDLERIINIIHARINLDHHKIEYRKYWLTMIIFMCSRVLSLLRGLSKYFHE